MVDHGTKDNIVDCIWLFKVEEKVDKLVDRLKARLVPNDMNQVKGLDYRETFSPIIKPISIKIILSIAVTNQWKHNHIDIDNVFLNGTLEKRTS